MISHPTPNPRQHAQKITFHSTTAFLHLKLSFTHASLYLAILNKEGKICFNGWLSHHVSCQKIIFKPSPTSNFTFRANVSPPSMLWICLFCCAQDHRCALIEYFIPVFMFLSYGLTVGKRKLQICCLESSSGVMLSCPSTGVFLFSYLLIYVLWIIKILH